MKKTIVGLSLFATLLAVSGCVSGPEYDVILRGGTVVDGTGVDAFVADVALRADTIAAIGDLSGRKAGREIDVSDLVVAPGFINMLSWANETLLEDGRSLSDITQGVTLEVMGEGLSMGPINESMRKEAQEEQGDITYDVTWTTLAEYLETLAKQGVSPNVASFVGAQTVRVHELGYEDRAPTDEELERMKGLVRSAMEEGAIGLASALIYAPGVYASNEELTALAEVVAEFDGLYASHIRSEGNRLLEAMDEHLDITEKSGVRSELYHMKAAGLENHNKLDALIAKIDSARQAGLDIAANMYNYTAGATGLDAYMPPWVQEGGYQAWADRLKNPEIRKRVAMEMRTPSDEWENLGIAAGPEGILLIGFKNPDLKMLTGRTLASIAAERGTPPEETAIDLVIEDGSRVGAVYFLMSEDNVRKQVTLPWVSFCSDAGSLAPEGVFLLSNVHPRSYGNFARLLGRYVRDEQLISIEEAVRRLASLPAERLRIQDRGRLEVGFFGDVVVFNPETIIDHSTFDEPHQLSEGMLYVFVNGEQVLEDGEHTGAFPGRVVYGPGRR